MTGVQTCALPISQASFVQINISYILLLVLVRRQIHRKVDDIQRHSWTAAVLRSESTTDSEAKRRESTATDGKASVYNQLFGPRLSRAKIREVSLA